RRVRVSRRHPPIAALGHAFSAYGHRPSTIWTTFGVMGLYGPSRLGTSPAFQCGAGRDRARDAYSAEPGLPACPSIRARHSPRGTEASVHRSHLSVLVIFAAMAACSKRDDTEGRQILSQDRALVAQLEL